MYSVYSMSPLAIVLMSGERVRKIKQLICTNVKIVLQESISHYKCNVIFILIYSVLTETQQIHYLL